MFYHGDNPRERANKLNALAAIAGRVPIAIGVIGQSNERGQVDPAEQIGGVPSRTAYPQAYASLRNPSLRYPIHPAINKQGGQWFKLYDDLWDYGYDARIINSGIGSMSMLRDAAGQIQSLARNTNYRAHRLPIGRGDYGYAGDYCVEPTSGKLFLCTSGQQAFCMSVNNNVQNYGSNAPLNLDYISVISPAGITATAAARPAAYDTCAVGDTVVDGGHAFLCLSANGTYKGNNYVATATLTEIRDGFDPFGILARMVELMGAMRDVRHKVVILKNGQSDVTLTAAGYSAALQNVAGYLLQRGLMVQIGLTYWQAAGGSTQAQYNNLSQGVANAITALQTSPNIPTYYSADDVKAGANLYALLGTTGNMAAGGAYFAKTAGQDNIHVNAPGAIEGGRLEAEAFKAWLERVSVPSGE